MELVVATVASAMLLAGLAGVMMIGRQVAYTPTAAEQRTAAADVVSQIAEELRYATLVIQQTPNILEFVVADGDADGTAERIRYAWSGTAGDPLHKRIHTGADVVVLDSVAEFSHALQLKAKTTTLKSTVNSAETLLLANTNVQAGTDRDITPTAHLAQQIDPAFFPAVPANALAWNATRLDVYCRKSGSTNEVLAVEIRPAGEPNNGPAGNALGGVNSPEASISASYAWNTFSFPNPVRGLQFHRKYAVVFSQTQTGSAAKILVTDSTPTGVLQSEDGGATWQFMTTRQMYGRLYGTYTTPGPAYDVTRNYVSHVQLALRSSDKSHARVDASVPLVNSPESLSAYWRTDFDRNPATTDANGDAVADWVLAGGGSFDVTKLVGGVWYAAGALETRPLSDFAATTTVEVRSRNSSVGGNGGVVQINADRSGGQYAPLLVYVQRQADGSQTLTLLGKPSDATTLVLCSRPKLSGAFVRFRLTIVPQNNVVNLQINDEDQGTYTYPTYAPSSASDGYVTLYADTSLAEFDYVDVRVAN